MQCCRVTNSVLHERCMFHTGCKAMDKMKRMGGINDKLEKILASAKSCWILCNIIILKMIRATREINKIFLQGKLQHGRLIFHLPTSTALLRFRNVKSPPVTFQAVFKPASKLSYLGERSKSHENARVSGEAARATGKESLQRSLIKFHFKYQIRRKVLHS